MNGDKCNMRDKEFCTKSVLNFLKSNPDVVKDYLDSVYEEGYLPNYSDMLRTISGTTVDEVDLASTMVVRREITKYLRSLFSTLY